MKTSLFVAALVGTLSWSGAVAQDVTKSRTISGVQRIKARNGVEVFVKTGPDESLHIDAKGHSEDELVVEQQGDELLLSIKLEGLMNKNKRRSVKAYLTVRELRAATASAGGSIKGEGTFKADAFAVDSKAGGTVSLDLEVRDLTVNAGAGGEATLTGTASTISASAGSGGSIQAGDLVAETVDASASAGGSVRVNAKKELFAKASMGGSISNRGSGRTVSKRTSLGGSVD